MDWHRIGHPGGISVIGFQNVLPFDPGSPEIFRFRKRQFRYFSSELVGKAQQADLYHHLCPCAAPGFNTHFFLRLSQIKLALNRRSSHFFKGDAAIAVGELELGIGGGDLFNRIAEPP